VGLRLRCTHKMSFTKKPTKPMTMKPRPVRSAILENSRRSGLVHRFTSLQGLTLVHFSGQLEPRLVTRKTPYTP